MSPVEPHLCGGSAGTCSVLNPNVAVQLRDRKHDHLAELEPTVIVSANIGCITHLRCRTGTPVRHWIELPDQAPIDASPQDGQRTGPAQPSP